MGETKGGGREKEKEDRRGNCHVEQSEEDGVDQGGKDEGGRVEEADTRGKWEMGQSKEGSVEEGGGQKRKQGGWK